MPRAPPRRPISKQRCRRSKDPGWLVRRALHQAIGSLIHPDLSCGAESFPEDLTPRRFSSPCYGGPRVRIHLPPAKSRANFGTRGNHGGLLPEPAGEAEPRSFSITRSGRRKTSSSRPMSTPPRSARRRLHREQRFGPGLTQNFAPKRQLDVAH